MKFSRKICKTTGKTGRDYSKETETIRKNPEEMLQTKNTIKEIKSIYKWLINRLNTAKEAGSELENRSTENIQTETHTHKKREGDKIENQPRMVRNFHIV